MSKSTRRRPELEPLEAVVLMSTVPAAAHHAAKAAAPAGPAHLVGTFPIKVVTSRATSQAPAETDLVGNGNIVGLGRTKIIIAPGQGDPDSGPNFELIHKGPGAIAFLSGFSPVSLPARGGSTTAPYELLDPYGSADVNPAGTSSNPTGLFAISDVVPGGGKDNYVLKMS